MDSSVELKLLLKIITSIPTNPFNLVNIDHNDIEGLYIYGSRLWGTYNEDSDLDYVIILSNTSPIWKYNDKKYIQLESADMDFHILSLDYYEDLVRNCDEFALSIYFQEEPLLKYNDTVRIDELNLKDLRKSFSTKSNNSYVKAKKKLTVEDDTPENRLLSIKSLYHSIRILDFGAEIAKAIQCKSTKIVDVDWSSFGMDINIFKDTYEYYDNDWGKIHEKFKPKHNYYASKFKMLAPKV